MAIVEVLDRRGFTPWETLVARVEETLGAGCFGRTPQARVWSDIRALREAGVAIGYSRARGTVGYFLRLEALPVHVQNTIRAVMREIDFEHLDRVAQVSPARRVEAVFEMSVFGRELHEAGQRYREQTEQR